MSDLHREQDPPRYHCGPVLTPFVDKTTLWDRPIGYWRERAYVWRMACLGTLTLCLLVLLWIVLALTAAPPPLTVVQVTPKGFVSGWGVLSIKAGALSPSSLEEEGRGGGAVR